MAPIVENWAKVSGTVKSITDNPKMEGYKQITLSLKSSKEVGDFPNLAKADEGTDIVINVRAEEMDKADAVEGEHFAGTVRKAFGQIYFLK
jgi:hypothetical protein